MTDDTAAIDVNAANYPDLLEYARTALGLKVKGNISKADLIDQISRQTGQKVAASESGASDANLEPGLQVQKNLRELRSMKKVEVFVHENKDHPQRIPVSVNGVPYTLKPGAWCKVPEAVAEVLRNAVQTQVTQVMGDDGRITNVQHNSLQFPFMQRDVAA